MDTTGLQLIAASAAAAAIAPVTDGPGMTELMASTSNKKRAIVESTEYAIKFQKIFQQTLKDEIASMNVVPAVIIDSLVASEMNLQKQHAKANAAVYKDADWNICIRSVQDIVRAIADALLALVEGRFPYGMVTVYDFHYQIQHVDPSPFHRRHVRQTVLLEMVPRLAAHLLRMCDKYPADECLDKIPSINMLAAKQFDTKGWNLYVSLVQVAGFYRMIKKADIPNKEFVQDIAKELVLEYSEKILRVMCPDYASKLPGVRVQVAGLRLSNEVVPITACEVTAAFTSGKWQGCTCPLTILNDFHKGMCQYLSEELVSNRSWMDRFVVGRPCSC